MTSSLQQFLSAITKAREAKEVHQTVDVIEVSETVSIAASVYESLRNTLEYDDEHLLRRNAIRRILKRKLYEDTSELIAALLLRELIWARYLPNRSVPESMITDVARILEKYKSLFLNLDETHDDCHKCYNWLLDLVATEVEQLLAPPIVDEALASYAYQELKPRMNWASTVIALEDQDMQLYIAIHRAVLKSDSAHTRYRVFTLFYPDWPSSCATDPIINEIGDNLPTVMHATQSALTHEGAETMYKLIRKYAFVFRVLRDIAEDYPEMFSSVVENKDFDKLAEAAGKAADVRYRTFRSGLARLVVRAVMFLFLTKMILALLIEFPYEYFVLKTTNYLPLVANIIVHPLLLGVIGISVRIPQTKNTAQLISYMNALLGGTDEFEVLFKVRRPWSHGAVWFLFNVLYSAVLVSVLGTIVIVLHTIHFNFVSIFFFIFFLSLVLFLGLKIRYRKRELLVVHTSGGVFSTLIDVLFLPIVRLGRWIALRAPRVNILLFFFDFIVEAPFKGAIRLIESWLAFLKEKKEEIE